MKRILIVMLLIGLGKESFTQVNPQTGSATFSLPIFNWNDNQGRLNSVVALNYNSGNGLKVDEVASNVGQGWNLIAGGCITRMVAGQPDDQYPREGEVEDVSKYPPGYLYNTVSPSYGCHYGLTKYPIFKDENHVYKQHNSVDADREADRFIFQFNGRMGMFVLKKGEEHKGIVLGDSKLKITFDPKDMTNQGIRTRIDVFYIQDENGLKYTFSTHAFTTVLKTDYCDPTTQSNWIQPGFDRGNVYHESSHLSNDIKNPYIINGWYLTEIEDVLTHRVMKFRYNRVPYDIHTGTSLSYYAEKEYGIITHFVSKGLTQEIGSIIYPDGHRVIFNYGSPRIDYPDEKALGSIDITYQGRYLAKYELTTSYFISNRIGMPTTEYQNSVARLCLKSIRKIGVDLLADDPPYVFDYYLGSSTAGDIIPAPFTHLKDNWGFYDADNSRTIDGSAIPLSKPLNELGWDEVAGLCFLRNSNPNQVTLTPRSGYAKNGLLKQITYPAGGSIIYDYEQNTGMMADQDRVVGGVHVSRISVRDGNKTYNCDDNTVITDYNYASSSGSSLSSLTDLEMPVNTYGYTIAHYEPNDKHYHYSIHACGILGCCKYRYVYPGILSREQAIDLSGSKTFWESIVVILDVVNVLCVIMDVVTVCTGGSWVSLIIDIVLGLFNLIYSCLYDYSHDEYTTIYYNSDLKGSNPMSNQFKRVEVTESPGTNGKTVMEFTSSSDYPFWDIYNPTFSMKQRYAPWAYGLLKKSTVYDASDNPIKQTENIYDFSKAKSGDTEEYIDGIPTTEAIEAPSCKCFVKRSESQRIVDWHYPDDNTNNFVATLDNPNLKAEVYETYTGRVELDTTYERTFKAGSNTEYIETFTKYNYDAHNYLPISVEKGQSNGNITVTSTSYSADSYSWGSSQGYVLRSLIDNNILNLPVSTRSVIKKIGSTPYAFDLNETAIYYAPISNGDIKPVSIFEHRYETPTPVSTSSADYYLGPGSLSNSYYKRIQVFTYDGKGNVINTQDEGDHKVTNIYDYNDKYIVASAIDAPQRIQKDGCVYNSFETESLNGYDKWKLIGSPSYSSTQAVTGRRSFILNENNALKSEIYPGLQIPYIISLWAVSNQHTITGISSTSTITLMKSGPVVNGFTYYEYQVVGSDFKITGTTTIDELRMYPAYARMRTVAYDPLIGKISECDENNRITYYEYDEHGRLRFIKDENNNILKMYEYNYANKKSNITCGDPIVYTNLEITEYFRKNDCGKDLIGVMVPYTITAGTYTSTVSQDEVDQMVQNDLDLNGQQNANNNLGACSNVFYNEGVSLSFTKQGCDIGLTGTSITYTVPAGRYTSIISQEDADRMATMEINANGQAYANYPGNASCIVDYEPDWIGTGVSECYSGTNPSDPLYQHLMVQVVDQNPNSSYYGTYQMSDGGLSASCGGSVPVAIPITYINQSNLSATVLLTDATNHVTSFTLPPNVTTQTTVGQVLTGTYDVKIIVPWGSSATTIHVYSSQQTGGFNATSVSISTTGSPIIKIDN